VADKQGLIFDAAAVSRVWVRNCTISSQDNSFFDPDGVRPSPRSGPSPRSEHPEQHIIAFDASTSDADTASINTASNKPVGPGMRWSSVLVQAPRGIKLLCSKSLCGEG